MMDMEKNKQLSVLAEQCNSLPVIMKFRPEQQSVTAIVPPPWDAVSEQKARHTQETIKELSKQYPDVICYCFDSFSTLLYVL